MKERSKLSSWAKVGLFSLVVVTATALSYFTVQLTLIATVAPNTTLDSSTLRLIGLAGGVVGAAVNFAFVWGIGRLVGLVALKDKYHDELFLALALASTLANTLGTSLVLLFAKNFATFTSCLWLVSFAVCYYLLVDKKWRPTLTLTGVYAVGVLLGGGASLLLN